MSDEFVQLNVHAPTEEAALKAGIASQFGIVETDPFTKQPRWIESGPSHSLTIIGTLQYPPTHYAAGPVIEEGWWAVLYVAQSIAHSVLQAMSAVGPQYGLTLVDEIGYRPV